LVPSFDSGGDFVRVCGPREGPGIIVGLVEEAVDGSLQFADGSKDAALEPALGELAKKPSTALSQEDEVGVKWKVNRGWRSSHLRTFGCLWVA
jgi:hypothetical protein